MSENVDESDAPGHSTENRKRNRALKHDNSGSSVTLYPPKKSLALNSESLASVEADEKETVEALYSLSQSCEMLPVTPTGPMSKMKKISSDEDLKAATKVDPSPQRLAYLMDLNASGRITQAEKDELFNLLVQKASAAPDPPPLERKRTHSSDSIKLMAAPVGLPKSRENSGTSLASKSVSPSQSPFSVKNTYSSKQPEEKGKRPSLRRYEKLQTIVSGVELEDSQGSIMPEHMRASVDVNDALKGLTLSLNNRDIQQQQQQQLQGVSRESSGSSTNSRSSSSGSRGGRKPRNSGGKNKSNSSGNSAAIPFEFGESGLSGFSVMSIPSVQDDLTPAPSREGSAFSLLLNALEQTSNRSVPLPTQWSTNPGDSHQMLESRDVSLAHPEAFYSATTAPGVSSGPTVTYAAVGTAGPRTAMYTHTVSAPGGPPAPGHPIYAATGDMLQYGAYGAASVPMGGYATLNGMALQQPGVTVTYAPYYPPPTGMTIETAFSNSSFSGVNYAVPLDTPNSTASGATNYAYMGSGNNTPSVIHHKTLAPSAGGAVAPSAAVMGNGLQSYSYDAGTSMQPPQVQQQPQHQQQQQQQSVYNYLNVHGSSAAASAAGGGMMSDEDDKGGKLDKEGRYISRNNYRCGKCGKQKANHVCAYVDTALTNMANQTFSPILDTYHMAIFAGDKILTVSKRKNIHDTFDYAGHHNKFNFNQYRPFNPATYMPHLTASPLPPGTRPPSHHGTQLYSRLPFTYDMVLEQLHMVAMQQQQAAAVALGLAPMPVNFYGPGPSAPVLCQPAAVQQQQQAQQAQLAASNPFNKSATMNSAGATTTATVSTATVSANNNFGAVKSVIPQLNTQRGTEMAISTTSIDSELSLF